MKQHVNQPIKRMLSLLMVLAMVLTLLPTAAFAAGNETTLYLSPGNDWCNDGARFAAYFFGNGESWVDMTDEDADGLYEVVVPEGFSSVIFCRMNPATTDNNWDNKWNQTGDLTVPTDGTNLYTIENPWNESYEWKATGSWSTHVAEVVIYLQPGSDWSNDGARFAAYFFGNGEVWADMTDEDADGNYEVVVPEGFTSVIFCRMNPATTDNNWDNKWNQTQDLTVPSDDSNLYIIENPWNESYEWKATGSWSSISSDEPSAPSDPVTPTATYYVAGSSGLCNGVEWGVDSAVNQMSDADGDGVYEIVFENVAPGTYEFKVTPGNWNESWGDNGGNYVLVVSETSNITVIFDSNTKSVSTSDGTEEPPIPTASYYVAGDSALCNGVNWGVDSALNLMSDADGNGVYELIYENVAAGTYSLKVTAGNWDESWGDNGNNYTFEVSDTCHVTVSFDSNTKTVSVTGDHVSKPTKLEISTMHAVGSGSGNWLDGKVWDTSANAMEEISEGVYQITFENVTSGSYEFKFAADKSWTHSWGGGGAEGEAVYNGQNILLTISYALANVTLQIDMTGYDHTTKSGATYAVTVTEVESGEDPDPSEPSEPDIPEGDTTVTLHFSKPAGWGDNINAYIWIASGALAGYGDYNAWPGKAVSDADGDGWYDLAVVTESAFNFIFNDGGNQTADLYTGEITESTELWVVGNDVYTEVPSYTATIHFQKPEAWGETVNAWIWGPNGALPGYEQYNTTWPGSPISINESNAGWYDITVETDANAGFNFIFNDGSNQTTDLSTGILGFKTELWVVNEVVSNSTPAGWIDPNLAVYVPGTFPGPSWDAASNQMSYDEALGLYVYTFENVPAANYEFKIAINGSWSENYGAGGAADGANISVTVPEAMHVTVYYNHNTHNAVTSVNYKFVDATVSGTGIESVKMTDDGLSGIYSGTVSMAAGSYSDIVINCDGKDYAFAPFQLEDAKEVTFYIDPVTGIFYHNGSNLPIDAASIHYDSQDLKHKAPFGAVAQNEEVTFSIQTGADITSAVLVIKGVSSVPMTKAEDSGLWSCTTSIANIGEYDYYFVLSNGSAVAVYGDDDGYYGEGTVSELTTVMPYDLVVYEAGFQTPDWMKDAVIYQIFPDRFFDGDEFNNQAQTWARGEVDYEYVTDWYALPENPEQEAMLDADIYKATGAYYGDRNWSNEIYGGDLEGITQRIGYLKALGVNVIYLNPVFWSISNHRYDAVDYTEIDPILGTLGDFEELVAVAEANGMHIILDGVFNHVSDDSVYFDRYYKFLGTSEKIGAYPYWAYVYDYMAENGSDQAAAEAAAKAYFSENYGITDYVYTEWFAVSSTPMAAVDNIGLRAGKAVYSYEGWWGYDSMPVIYSTNGSEYQTGNWAEEIIYNNNKDSVTQYWITKGNNGWRLDVANEVSDETWQKFRDSVKALDSETVIIGEIWDDATKYLMGDMYDSVMNYQFRNAVTSYAMGTNADNTTKAMEKIRERYPEEAFYAMMNLVGSHDTSRILSYLDGIGDDRADKSLAAAFPTYETTSDLAKNRQYLVSFLQFTYAGAPTIYYGDEIGMVGSDDPDDRRAFQWGQGNQELVEWYASLAAIRAAYPALRTGSVQPIDLSSASLLGYVRSDAANDIIVIANNAQTAQTASLAAFAEGEYVDLITGNTVSGSVTVDALRGVILVAKDKAVAVTVNTAGLAPAYDTSYTVAERCAHKISETVVAPTCTEQGCTKHTCSICNVSYCDTYVDALGHTWGEWVLTEEPTANTEGKEVRTCEICKQEESRPVSSLSNPFNDLEAGEYYYDAVLWAANAGITNGYGEADTFCPDIECSRGQIVTMLWRAAGEPAPTASVNPFTDIKESDYYYTAVLWAVEEGITKGYGSETIFNPDGVCTRGQVATFLWRAAGEPAPADSKHPFTDIDEDEFFYTAVLWAVENEITEGYGTNDIFAPDLSCTRAQIVTFLYRNENAK